MDDMKQWYASKTVWGGLIAILASLMQAAGVELDPTIQGDMADNAVALAGAIGGLVAIYGRPLPSDICATGLSHYSFRIHCGSDKKGPS